jgi:maleylacetate reductase
MMQAFTYKSLPAHVLFGAGTLARLPGVVAELGGTRALLLSTPQRASQVRALGGLLGNLAVAYFHEATLHTPVEITERAMREVHEHRIDIVVALGGGSTIGLGKAIGLRTDIAQIAIPTTYAGSEMTPIIGQTSNGIKTTQRSIKVLPRAVIYDVELTLGLPPSLSGTSGINAIAHAVEGLYAQDTNPVMQLMAEEGIRALAQALPRIVRVPGDRQARAEALCGAWLCGTVLGNVGMALHHKLCHTVGGSFNLPHAETHAIILPHAVSYNALAVPEAVARVARALDVVEPANALFDLARLVSAPAALRDLGMPEAGVQQAVDEVLRNPYWNPMPLERSALTGLLQRAWAGERPRL